MVTQTADGTDREVTELRGKNDNIDVKLSVKY